MESTVDVLTDAASIGSAQGQREVLQMGSACTAPVWQMPELQSVEILAHQLEAFRLTPDLINDLHGALMKKILHNAGQYRTAFAYAAQEDGGARLFQEPQTIDATLQTVRDQYNGRLQGIAQQPGSLHSPNVLLGLIKLAATLFAELVAVHTFSDGNGRLGRLLMAHVLHSVTPFLVTPSAAQDHKASRVWVLVLGLGLQAKAKVH